MYVFFDIDGVLNKRSQWKQFYSLDASCVACFCAFLRQTGGIPIIMSSWRTGFLRSGSEKNSEPIRRLEKMLSGYGVRIAEKTGKNSSRDREILDFIAEHENGRYIVIDDDPDEYKTVLPHTFFTDAKEGFTKKSIRGCLKCI